MMPPRPALCRASLLLCAVSLLCTVSLLCAAPALHAQAPPQAWVGTWAAAQQVPEPQNALAPDQLRDTTLRQVVHLSLGGSQLRVHLSNEFGTEPLHLLGAHIARPLAPGSSSIDPATDRALTFAGSPDLTIPAGAEFLSDPVPFPAPPLSDLAITLAFSTPPARQTSHPGSRSTSFLSPGNHLADPALPNATTVEHWYQISAVDVLTHPTAAAIVTFGDSITDGHGATTDANNRWPDNLARRLQAAPGLPPLAVLNTGIGGNRLLADGLGPNALARFDRDILARTGVRTVILLEGINDLGILTRDAEATPAEHQLLVQHLIAAYRQLIDRAHAHHLTLIGATLTPWLGSDYYHPGPLTEADRQALNQWIRTPGHFDAILDFDQVVRDPAHPGHLLPAFDSGDHLHPSPAGYRAMADSIPTNLFKPHNAPR